MVGSVSVSDPKGESKGDPKSDPRKDSDMEIKTREMLQEASLTQKYVESLDLPQLNDIETHCVETLQSLNLPTPPLRRVPPLLQSLYPPSFPLLSLSSVRCTRFLLSVPSSLPLSSPHSLNYAEITGRNCDNCIGYIPLPLGHAGPLPLTILTAEGKSDKIFNIPLATTEGGLIASISRGLKAMRTGKTTAAVTQDVMTRSPVIEFESLELAVKFKGYVEEYPEDVRSEFERGSRYLKLKEVECKVVGRTCYLRLGGETGEAMGMNMISKGSESLLKHLQKTWPLKILSVSGNYCCDKKPSALNFIKGRGKSVTLECTLPTSTVLNVLKTTPEKMCKLNYYKNSIGSSLACTIGGCNAQAANVVAAIYLATGQDPAHVVEGSQCVTVMEVVEGGLYVSVTLPSLCLGTVGGGTELKAQKGMIEYSGAEGGKELACVVGGGVMAGEISLVAALVEGELVKAHMELNRKK
ncbi:hypothetical protein TrST_g11689 [Triparma strigata]|uniref:hydroxymethylglutaryl-CoA reductase (NADPH) n=1 Tax=Triparma strigata TaxID=1606541 RepID=A0A9W7B1L2_9STRA|nr:hypothetical protein TrST_g11689 [Triparma strigata]